MKTFSTKLKDIKRDWYYIDAKDKTLGRLASVISTFLRGKHKVEYTPHLDTGDYIIVLNASKILITGKKNIKKTYFHHTGYVGGIKKVKFKDMISQDPTKVIELAVKGMLPRGPLGRSMFKKLKVFSNEMHNHQAQCPKLLNI